MFQVAGRRAVLMLLALSVFFAVAAWIGTTRFDIPHNGSPLLYWAWQGACAITVFSLFFRMPNAYLQYGTPLFLFVCSQVLFLVLWQHDRASATAPSHGDLLSWPCLTVELWVEEDLSSPVGLTDCRARYTNPGKTAAVVEAEIWQGQFHAHVFANTVTDGGPLASLNWRVVDGTKTAWQIAEDK